MKFGDLDPADRRVALIFVAVVALLVLVLFISGVWLLLFHNPTWDRYIVGADRPIPRDATGMADVHSTCGDLLMGAVFLMTAWLSYRVFAKVMISGLIVLGTVFAAALIGDGIRVNAVVRGGKVDPEAKGFLELVSKDFDYAIVGTTDLAPTMLRLLLALHLAALPLMAAVVAVVWWRARTRAQPVPEPSWLDQI